MRYVDLGQHKKKKLDWLARLNKLNGIEIDLDAMAPKSIGELNELITEAISKLSTKGYNLGKLRASGAKS